MIRWACLLPLAAAACSSLDEGDGGVVSLEVQIPPAEERTFEVGGQTQLSAQALDADGNPVAAAITWRASSAAVSVEATGLVTGVSAGTADVQAAVGSLSSERVGFVVLASADTLVIEGDSVVVVPPGVDPRTTPALVVRLDSRAPPGPVASRPVIYEITGPPPGVTPVVQLTGGVQIDTLVTGTDGRVTTVTLETIGGQAPPDTAIVTVRASRANGSSVPGSGQRFIVQLQ